MKTIFLALLAIIGLLPWTIRGGETNPPGLLDPVCGFTAGPHYYLDSASVRQGLRVDLLSDSPRAGKHAVLRFSVTQQPKNLPVDKLQIEHEKFMHVIGVRDDLTEFFHAHPVRTRPGLWELSHASAKSGSYQIWVEIKHLGTSYSFTEPRLLVEGPTPEAVQLDQPTNRVEIDGGWVKLEAGGPVTSQTTNQLSFFVSDTSGAPLALENFLGTPMHLFIVREGASICLHAHPRQASTAAGMVQFIQSFPQPGAYKLFAQFRPKIKHLPPEEAVLAQFVINVAEPRTVIQRTSGP